MPETARSWPARAHVAGLACLLLAGSGTLLDARPAHAQTPPAAAAGPLVADIDAGGSGLDPERLRAAVSRELGVEVRAGGADDAGSKLTIRVGDGRRATVRFQRPASRGLERTVELPADPERSYETIALLAGNLARDEASELLEELRRSRAPAPDGEVPVSEPPPPAAPAEKPPSPPPTVAPRPKPKREPAKPAARPPARAEPAEPKLDPAPVNLSVWSPLALYRDAERRRVNLELGAAYSRVGAIDGAGVTFGYLDVLLALHGAGIALGVTRARGSVHGAQIAVGGNLGGADLHGAALAVGFNQHAGKTGGAQLAVGYNGTGRLEGAQLGFINVTGKDQPSDGVQGGLINVAGAFNGPQLGLVNVGGHVSGAQLGLINVGTEVDGAMVGLVNVADRVDGVALGLVNVVGNARTRFVAWADSSARGNLGLKYQHQWLMTMISGSYRLNRLNEPQGKLIEPAFAIGGHADFGKNFVELDVQYTFQQANDEVAKERHVTRYRLTVGHDPVKRFGGFVGGAFEQTFDRDGQSAGALGFAGVQLF